jgi:hypothetical protein
MIRRYFEALDSADPLAIAIFVIALLVAVGIAFAIGIHRAKRYRDRQRSRRDGYHHRLRRTRPTIVYEGRTPSPPPVPRRERPLTREEDPWRPGPHERDHVN